MESNVVKPVVGAYLDKFALSVRNIGTLIEVPDVVRDFILEGLDGLNLSSSLLPNTEKIKFENLRESIANIQDEAIRNQYKVIYNQLCILLVSATSAILEEYFIDCVNGNPQVLPENELEKIKINLADLKSYNFKPEKFIGSILMQKDNSISFQNLKSIKRSFKDYLNINPNLDSEIGKKIIFYQECRHNLVHKNGIIDNDFIEKVNKMDANIKNLQLGDKIQLFINDWEDMRESFTSMVNSFITYEGFRK